MSHRVRQLAGLALAAAALSGCGMTSDHAMRLTLAALGTRVPPPRSPPPARSVACAHKTASLRPPARMPAPGEIPAGSFMRTIENRGYLVAGVNAALLDFGYLEPSSGKIEGFEIDLVRALARAIFGDASPNRVHLVAMSVPQRIPFVQQGRVDIVVDAVTITCARKQQVDFSTVYYDAQQRLLVPTDSRATSIDSFAGQPVCASAQSAPIEVMRHLPDPPKPIGAPQAIDCLVDLQEGRVAAISTDDSILDGFKAQDPNTNIVGASLGEAPYGMAINKAHPEFVRFVNGTLAKLRADGTWRALYDQWLGRIAPHPSLPPAQYDG
jgi:polar amino acid transport system substrate-binding protein